MNDVSTPAQSGRNDHAHRLGPFGTDADPSPHDEAIAAAVGAVVRHCERCTDEQIKAIAADRAAFARLLELTERAHVERNAPLEKFGDVGSTIVGWVEQPPAERTAIVERMSTEDRVPFARTAVGLLLGMWIFKQLDIETPRLEAEHR